jgi:LysM repeat protein
MRRLIVLGLVVVVWLMPALAVPAAAAPQAQGYTVHVVQPGETLYAISLRYGVSASAIATANNLVNPNYIYAGQQLVIPGSYAPPPAPPPSGNCSYVVKLGDTLSSIAWQHGTTVQALMSANGITNPNYIYAGQTLVIPGCQGSTAPPPPPQQAPCGQHYTVQPGDTLSGIAARYGMSWLTLARANGITYPYMIYSGQSLYIPCPGGSPPPPPHGHKPGHAPKPTAAPALHPAACWRERQIVDPLEGETVGGTVQIIGTASHPNFQFYKIEYAMGHNPQASTFHSINNTYSSKVWDGVLATWYAGNMPEGAYTLRLTVVDNQGQYPEPCNVHIYIDN